MRLQRLDRLRLSRARVLDRLRLVEDHQRPLARAQRLDARERAVGGDDEVGGAEVGAGDVGQLARGHRGRMRDQRRQRRREALDLGLPVREQRCRRHQQVWRLAAARATLAQQQERQHLDGLAQPHVVGQADAEPQRGRESQPRNAGLLIRPQRSAEVVARVGRGETVRSAQPLERARQPRAGLDARPALTRRQYSGLVVRPPGAGQQPHAFEEREPPVLGLAPHALPVGEHLAQPLAVELDPLPSQAHQPARRGQKLSHLGGGELVVAQRDRHREVEQRVHAEHARLLVAHAHGDLGARRAPGAPPVGHAHDQSRRLEGRDRLQEPVGLGRCPRHRLVDGAGIDQLGQPRHLLGGALQRHQQVEQRLAVLARRGFLQRPCERPMLHLAAGARPHGIGGEEGERMLLVAAVLGQVQADLADRVPRRMPRVEPRRHGPAVRPDLVGERGVDVRPPGDDPLAVHVLGALHGRHRARQPVALVRWAVDLHALAALLEIGRRAEPGHERVAHLAQERKIRGQWGVELGGAEIEQRVAGTAVEGASEAGARGGGEAVARGAWSGRGIEQQRAGGKNGDAHASCDARRKRPRRS